MIPHNNFWWLSRSLSSRHVFFSSKFEWSPLRILPKFSAIPPFGFSVTTDPLHGINNDRSLMRFAIIMQHVNMAYHMQRAYKGPTIWLLRGGGGGGGRGGIGDSRKKDILKSDFEHKKNLARKYLPYNSFVCRGKVFWFGEKKFLRKPIKSPIPRSKSNGRPLITCRKSGYRRILSLRHQSLIVHSRSKLVHVYSLLHDEFNTAGRLGTF